MSLLAWAPALPAARPCQRQWPAWLCRCGGPWTRQAARHPDLPQGDTVTPASDPIRRWPPDGDPTSDRPGRHRRPAV